MPEQYICHDGDSRCRGVYARLCVLEGEERRKSVHFIIGAVLLLHPAMVRIEFRSRLNLQSVPQLVWQQCYCDDTGSCVYIYVIACDIIF